MRTINKTSIILLFIFIQANLVCIAEEPGMSKSESTTAFNTNVKHKSHLFIGKVNADNINIRSDSTAGSELICKINKNDDVEVLSELYDWYKIRLPKTAPAFIKKDFVELTDDKTGKVLKGKVNVRLRPDTSSPILGKLNQDEAINILEDKGDWYKIEPVDNTYGWIHKNFVKKGDEKELELAKQEKPDREVVIYKDITVEGTIKPKIMQRIATHKLISEDKEVYLLKGNKEELSSFNNRRARILGKTPDPAKQENPIINVEKIEALD